jgi:hypothetical protein
VYRSIVFIVFKMFSYSKKASFRNDGRCSLLSRRIQSESSRSRSVTAVESRASWPDVVTVCGLFREMRKKYC